MDNYRNDSHTGTKIVAWLALILALLALGLAWMAYNRTGTDLEDRIQQQIQQGTNSVQDTGSDAANEAQDAANDAGDAAQDAGQRIDEGPDGVDEDDTDTPQTTPPQQ